MKNNNPLPMQTAQLNEAAENDEIESMEVKRNANGEGTVLVNMKPIPAKQYYLTVRRNISEPRVYSNFARMFEGLQKIFKGTISVTYDDTPSRKKSRSRRK